jgi:UDP-N-acetylglucosamine diphosphorylase/glucosamine-1-phosphate N-acetyltransferase
MRLILFEDAKVDRLYPLTYTRPAFELKCGITTLREKIEARARKFAGFDSVACFVRDWLAASYAEKTDCPVNDLDQLDGEVLLINGRMLVDCAHEDEFGPDQMLTCGGATVAARVSAETLAAAKADTFDATLAALDATLEKIEVEATLINYTWDLVHHNAAMIANDCERLYTPGVRVDLDASVAIVGDRSALYVAESATILPQVVLDVSEGPIVIEDGVTILPHTRVEGPGYFGPGVQLHGGKIREGCSFGPQCRVGGEVEGSIIHGYSNKYHDGFLGHSYVGEWVNLGAMTCNSDLKNDYSTVSAYVRGELVDSGEQFLGTIFGDHTKTSIGTLLNTGTTVGVMCNLVFDGKLMPKYVPSFCWMLNGRPTRGTGFKGMLTTARRAMKRRTVEMTDADAALLEHLRDMLKPELRAAIKRAFKK